MKNEILASIVIILLLCTIIGYNVQVKKAEAEIQFNEDDLLNSSEDDEQPRDIQDPVINNEFPPNNWACNNLRPTISLFVSNDTGILVESNMQLYVQNIPVKCQILSENNGYNVSYCHETGFTNGELVRCRLEGNAINNHHYEYQWKFRADRNAVTFAKNLNAGWNLMSIPLELVDASIEGVFGSIEGTFERLYTYDGAGEHGGWISFSIHRNESMNTIDRIDITKAYWVYVTEDTTLFLSGVPRTHGILLGAGWNLVGYLCMEEKIVLDCLCGTGFTSIEGFDSSNPYYLKVMENTSVMGPGEGYWIHVPADTMWTVE